MLKADGGSVQRYYFWVYLPHLAFYGVSTKIDLCVAGGRTVDRNYRKRNEKKNHDYDKSKK